MKVLKKIWPYIVAVLLVLLVAVGALYGSVAVLKAPLSLPFMEALGYNYEIPQSSLEIMDQWRSRTGYEPVGDYDTIEDIIEDDNIQVEDESETDFYAKLKLVDSTSLRTYIEANPDVAENGYERLFIDKVDLLNTPTGIKSTLGDDVLAVDSLNGIVIVGRDVVSASGTSKVKLAIVDNKAQLDVNLVKDLSYWDRVEVHAENTGAILAVNASTYNWNERGNYGVLFGALKYHDTLYRKAVEPTEVSGFTADGTLVVGTNADSLYNAWETTPILIKDGVAVYTPTEGEDRYALSAVGQTADGKTLILTASGSVYGSNLGITPSEAMKILQDYGAVNATCLSGGSRTMMYWNGRNVTEAVDYASNGVRLPNAIIVKPVTAIPGLVDTTENTKDDTTESAEAASDSSEGNTSENEGNANSNTESTKTE